MARKLCSTSSRSTTSSSKLVRYRFAYKPSTPLKVTRKEGLRDLKHRDRGGFAYASDVRSVFVDQEKGCNDPSIPPAEAVEADQMSPKKALRVAMLRSRFADTILKATHQTLVLSHADKTHDPRCRMKEIERLEREELKEKVKIAAEMRAEIGRKRAAARLALEKMERSVVIDENKDILKDMELLGLCRKGDYDYTPIYA